MVPLAARLAVAASHEEARLSEQAERLADVRAQIEAARGQAADSEERLAQAEGQLAMVLGAVRAADEAVARSEQAVADAGQRLADAERQEQEQLRIAGARAVERYKDGNQLSLDALLTAENATEAVSRSAYLTTLGRSDQRAVEELAAARTLVDSQRLALEAEEDSQLRVLEEQQRLLSEVEGLRDERALVLAADEEELEELQGQERHLEAEAEALAALTREPSRVPVAAPVGDGDDRRGGGGGEGWLWPVDGTVTSEYGSRWGRLHAGIDIAAPTGTPIYAAQPGCVTFSGQQGGYGNIILLDHGGGVVTAYAHQSRLLADEGSCVAGGEQIGAVGSTGNSTGPHVHFEVRVNGNPRDPRGYLP